MADVCASGDTSLLEMIENRAGLEMLIASVVIIFLLILQLIFLQSINEHLNWIRRMR